MERWNKIFTDDVEMSQVVKEKVEEAFAMIEQESGDMKEKKKKHGSMHFYSMDRWTKVAAVAAVILLLGSGTVFAANRLWNMKGILENLPKEAEQYISSEISVKKTKDQMKEQNKDLVAKKTDLEKLKGLVSFEVKETLADKTSCHVTVEATLKDAKHYILSTDATDKKEEQAIYYYGDAKKGETTSDYAARIKKQILWVNCISENENYQEGREAVLEDESHALFHITLSAKEEAALQEGTELTFRHLVKLYEPESGSQIIWKQCKNEVTTIDLENIAADEESATYAYEKEKEIQIGDSGIAIQKINLKNTALETKLQVTFKNKKKKAGDSIAVSLVDEEGNDLEAGPATTGSISEPDENGVFQEIRAYKKMEFPDHINIKVRNLSTDDPKDSFVINNIPIVK